MCDNKGRILILNVTIDVKNFVLINLYYPNTENEQVKVLNTLLTMLKNIDINENTNILQAGDFNVFFKYKFIVLWSQSVFQTEIHCKTY